MQSTTGLPFLLREGMEVAFVPPALEALRGAHVASVQMSDERTAIVFFREINNIDVAEQLAGCHCLVHRDEISLDTLVKEDTGWTGWKVFDANVGFLGVVHGISELPGHTLLEVAAVSDEDALSSTELLDDPRIILIPLVDEFVLAEDAENCRIDVKVPSGLLDL